MAPPKKTVQLTLSGFGITRTLTTKAGSTVNLPMRDVADDSGLKLHRCPQCTFASSKAGPLQVHILTQHGPAATDSKGSMEPLELEETSVPHESFSRNRDSCLNPDPDVTITRVETTCEKPKKKTRGAEVRKAYDVEFKLRVLEKLEDIMMDGSIPDPQAFVGLYFNVSESLVSKWKKKGSEFRAELDSTRARSRSLKTKKLGRRKLGRYALQEAEVYNQFLEARRKGRRVSGRWLRIKMKKRVGDLRVVGQRGPFVASKKWLVNFCKRRGISLRKRTNKKNVSIKDRIDLIKKFHARLRRRLRRGTRVSDKWGRWLPHQRMNVDQVPCSLNPGTEYTYEQRGANRVWVASRKNGDDKREFTLQLLVKLDKNVEQPRPTIIFRGTGKRISKMEKSQWDERVNVMFQPKAWADSNLCVRWALEELPRHVSRRDEYVLFADNLGGQTTTDFCTALGRSNVKLHLLAANCTDEIQPIDSGVGKRCKDLMGEALDTWLEDDDNLDRWTNGEVLQFASTVDWR